MTRGSDRFGMLKKVSFCLVILGVTLEMAYANDVVIEVSPKWEDVERISKTYISMQVCVEPPMRRGSPIHDRLFDAIKNLKAEYVRFQPWRPYPRLAVAELYPPENGKTSWDFSLIDPLVEDFMDASEGRHVIFTFGTIPSWMLKTPKPDEIPRDPNEISWSYGMARDFTDFHLTVKLFAAYQARLAQWYLVGGFKDEYGHWHESGHHYRNVAYWGILNEPGAEHELTPQQYVEVYDAVVHAVRKVAPNMRFIGLSDDNVWVNRTLPENFSYFLKKENHLPETPLDAIAYHYYGNPDADETAQTMQYTSFKEADRLLTAASFVEVIRRAFAPTSKTIIEELGGSLLPWDATVRQVARHPIDPAYWNLSGAMWAYLYGNLVGIGIDMLLGSELIDYPGQAPTSTLVDWNTGVPNARYWVLELLHDHLKPGTKIVAYPAVDDTAVTEPDDVLSRATAKLYFRAFITPEGERKVLLVNKRNEPIRVRVSGADRGHVDVVDQAKSNGIDRRDINGEQIDLLGFAVAIVTLRS